VDGNVQDRRGAISVFNGPDPDIRECDDTDSETEQVAAWIAQAARTTALQMLEERGMGRGEISVSPHRSR
jgi:hypothetical protein